MMMRMTECLLVLIIGPGRVSYREAESRIYVISIIYYTFMSHSIPLEEKYQNTISFNHAFPPVKISLSVFGPYVLQLLVWTKINSLWLAVSGNKSMQVRYYRFQINWFFYMFWGIFDIPMSKIFLNQILREKRPI